MRTGSLILALRRLLAIRSGPGRQVRRRRTTAALSSLSILEARQLPSGTALSAAITLISAATADSQGVTVDYRINDPGPATLPLRFDVYRSSDPSPDAGDSLVGSWIDQESLDDNGQPATASGFHRLTIPLPEGLPPDPRRPYVVVAATAERDSANLDAGTAISFRKYEIGIVTHGALIHSSWKHGPPWQLQIAKLLSRQGFDAVIPFNWAHQSDQPGKAAIQGTRLARQVLQAAQKFPAGSPIDLQFIGHSEGAVVNTQAIVALQRSMTPELKAGYIVDTLLDPHAANNNAPGQASASWGPLGAIARVLISGYQARARDPLVFIPSDVDEAQVFYQHSPASTHRGIYNLWGQVPVPNFSDSPIAYYNLSAAGVIHSGNHGVALWYRNFVARSLGNQAPLIRALRLEGEVLGTTTEVSTASDRLSRRSIQAWGAAKQVETEEPTFSGTAAPGSKIRVYAGPNADLSTIGLVGRARADETGGWTVTARSLPRGSYRAVAMSYAAKLRSRPGLTIVPMAPLGRFTIGDQANR